MVGLLNMIQQQYVQCIQGGLAFTAADAVILTPPCYFEVLVPSSIRMYQYLAYDIFFPFLYLLFFYLFFFSN